MMEGLAVGFILSLTLFPGTVWLVKVGIAGNGLQVVAVGAAFALSQFIWLLVAIPGLLMMTLHLSFMATFMHLFTAFILLYMSYKMFRTRKVEMLDDAGNLPPAYELFSNAFRRSLAMPVRLPTAIAVLLATGVYINHAPGTDLMVATITGAAVGVAWWWGQFVFLSMFFAKRVPQAISIRSLNKIRPFAGTVYLLLVGLTLFFMN